jgi:N-acetylglucosaminyldiphosphoundecaprenol N-acetyl-beta-D-mannosaminyltransferase
MRWIQTKKIGILFVALGFPKQEFFINSLEYRIQNSEYRNPLVLMSVGGSFDYISGSIKRAPEWMQNMGLEWLYRLIKKPSRIGRQLKGARFF